MADELGTFATGSASLNTGNANKSKNLMLMLRAQESQYAKRYGGDPDNWRKLGTASLLAADFADGYTEYTNSQIALNTHKTQTKELQSRGDALLSLIGKQAGQVKAAQEGAFVKSGVKLEGSALNVLTDTMIQASQAEAQKKREFDWEMGQRKIEETMMTAKLDRAPLETLLGMGSTYAYAKAM
jgi:hypothetical protein